MFVVPLLAALEGISLRDLATAQKTEYILVLQTLETVQGVAVIWACVRKFQPLPPDLFRIDGCVCMPASRSCDAHARARCRSKPFSPENGWLVWGLLSYGAAFVAIAVAAGVASLFESGAPPSGNGTVDIIAPLVRFTVLRGIYTRCLLHAVNHAAEHRCVWLSIVADRDFCGAKRWCYALTSLPLP